MAGADGHIPAPRPLGKGNREHSVGLLGLSVRCSVGIPAALELRIVQIEILYPVACHVGDTGRG